MTFDEALEQLSPRTIWSPEMRDLLEQLRVTYAPTIEMTREEFTQFRFYLNNAKLLALLTDNSFGINQEDGESLFNRLTQENLAQVWLHPECIKVVE